LLFIRDAARQSPVCRYHAAVEAGNQAERRRRLKVAIRAMRAQDPRHHTGIHLTTKETTMDIRRLAVRVTRHATIALLALVALAASAQAALLEGTNRDDVLIGRDDDNQTNTQIQPAGAVNQSLDNGDVIDGRNGHDVLIGLLGNDVLRGGKGNDILIGGTEGGQLPNSDALFGDDHNDIALWRGGDGSEFFDGGRGEKDAFILGNIDRQGIVPTLSPVTGRHKKTGLPTADLTGQGGFCTLEAVTDPNFGFQFLVRFFVRATGNLAVTIRTVDVEQVFCTNQAGGTIIYADLTASNPAFVEVTLDDVAEINPTVAKIIR
jgi:hypothetical protein